MTGLTFAPLQPPQRPLDGNQAARQLRPRPADPRPAEPSERLAKAGVAQSAMLASPGPPAMRRAAGDWTCWKCGVAGARGTACGCGGAHAVGAGLSGGRGFVMPWETRGTEYR